MVLDLHVGSMLGDGAKSRSASQPSPDSTLGRGHTARDKVVILD
ncbi:MAG TPA: hypothetical protein VFI73_00840 [Candidatus Nitrosopolaris sp.]|nr:hypothetical protein [Candidatus Nitrosopolaris sp.]